MKCRCGHSWTSVKRDLKCVKCDGPARHVKFAYSEGKQSAKVPLTSGKTETKTVANLSASSELKTKDSVKND